MQARLGDGKQETLESSIRVGLRTTLTQHNYPQLPALLELMRAHDVQKFYLSAVHSDADIDATLAAAREVLAEMR